MTKTESKKTPLKQAGKARPAGGRAGKDPLGANTKGASVTPAKRKLLRPPKKGDKNPETEQSPNTTRTSTPLERCLWSLDKDFLRDILDGTGKDAPTSWTKEKLISGIVERGFDWDRFLKPELQDICEFEGLGVTGNKKKLIDHLMPHFSNKAAPSSTSSVGQPPKSRSLSEPPPRKEIQRSKRSTEADPIKVCLGVLSKDDLKPICNEFATGVSGNKTKLIDNLCEDGFDWTDFRTRELDIICKKLGVEGYGKDPKYKLVQRLRRRFRSQSSAGRHGDEYELEVPHVSRDVDETWATALRTERKESHNSAAFAAKFVGRSGEMSTSDYRKILVREGRIFADQDIFHIIAKGNGGADHVGNYHFGMGHSFNRSIGKSADPLNCYLVGKMATTKAVEVSRKFGTYRGDDAGTLFDKGQKMWLAMWKTHKLYERNK